MSKGQKLRVPKHSSRSLRLRSHVSSRLRVGEITELLSWLPHFAQNFDPSMFSEPQFGQGAIHDHNLEARLWDAFIYSASVACQERHRMPKR